ncbi:hypothetical protein [Salinimicrobium soli]
MIGYIGIGLACLSIIFVLILLFYHRKQRKLIEQKIKAYEELQKDPE